MQRCRESLPSFDGADHQPRLRSTEAKHLAVHRSAPISSSALTPGYPDRSLSNRPLVFWSLVRAKRSPQRA